MSLKCTKRKKSPVTKHGKKHRVLGSDIHESSYINPDFISFTGPKEGDKIKGGLFKSVKYNKDNSANENYSYLVEKKKTQKNIDFDVYKVKKRNKIQK